MIYPVIVLIAAGGVIALITVVLLPMFVSLLQSISTKAELPFASRALMAFSQFVRSMVPCPIPLPSQRALPRIHDARFCSFIASARLCMPFAWATSSGVASGAAYSTRKAQVPRRSWSPW